MTELFELAYDPSAHYTDIINPAAAWVLEEPFIARKVYPGWQMRNTKHGWQYYTDQWLPVYKRLSLRSILKALADVQAPVQSDFAFVKQFESAQLVNSEEYVLGEYTLFHEGTEWKLTPNLKAPQVSNLQALEFTDDVYAQVKREIALMRETLYGIRLDSLDEAKTVFVYSTWFDWSDSGPE